MRTLISAIGTGRAIADGLTHFAIGSIVAFCGLTLVLPILNEALFAAAHAAGVELPSLP
jgi:hypothetical protein